MQKLKLPLLKYLYYTFLESEKISDEFQKYIEDFKKYLKFESDRFLQAKEPFTEEFKYYFFEAFLFIINSYLKAFNNEMNQEDKPQDDHEDGTQSIKMMLEDLRVGIEDIKKSNIINLKLTEKQNF